MRAQHNTGILESYILGQACLSAALLIPALMKGREHLSLHYDVPDSPAKGFCVEADSTGWVRGYLMETHIPVEKPLENWDLRPFLGGEGYMTIQTVHPEDKYPQTSSFTSGLALFFVDALILILCIGFGFFVVNVFDTSDINFKSFVFYSVYIPFILLIFGCVGLYPGIIHTRYQSTIQATVIFIFIILMSRIPAIMMNRSKLM